MSIASRWKNISDQISIAEKMAISSQSTPANTSLQPEQSMFNSVPQQRIVSTIAVSKRQVVDSIKQAYDAGARNFGESFIQEALPKIETLASLDAIQWHFIGPIQSNKTRQIAEKFDWVQSVSREKIAQRLSTQRPQPLAPLNVLIQINISTEDSKSGATPQQMLPLAKQISTLPNLKLRGLMCIPEKSADAKTQAENFHRMNKLLQTLIHYFKNDPAITIDTLSMGMSSDFQEAILAGSNMVRIGSALFGSRD